MSNKNTHNTVYLITTLSVYFGLVFVGSSPLVSVETFESFNQGRCEISTTKRITLSRTELRSNLDCESDLIFPTLGSRAFLADKVKSTITGSRILQTNTEIASLNDQVFVVTNLARASL